MIKRKTFFSIRHGYRKRNLIFIEPLLWLRYDHGNIRTRYHCSYDGLHLNDKDATLFTENILSALNKVAWPQSVKVNSSSKSFSDYDNIRAKGNAFTSTKGIKAKHPKNLFFGHLNVNSIRNKFVSIEELIKITFDIFLISETKIEDSFPNA